INAFKGFSSFKPMKLSVEVDGVMHEYPKAYTIAIQNGRYFGGGMKATPDANPEADTFQALVVHSISPALISFLFMTIYSGLHLKFKKYVTLLVGKHFKITCDAPQYFQNDGEVLENVSTVDIAKSKTREFFAFDYAAVALANKK
ncbi:MAG: hypothetical protein Q8N15_00755, partial [Bacillota bacterium]|nr:hypothetical protein [Bacillota bacterium]